MRLILGRAYLITGFVSFTKIICSIYFLDERRALSAVCTADAASGALCRAGLSSASPHYASLYFSPTRFLPHADGLRRRYSGGRNTALIITLRFTTLRDALSGMSNFDDGRHA